ncbi:MAG: DUF58 domain-containing protein [Pseudomonadota bacterium]
MIAPTPRAVWIMAGGIPILLALAIWTPALWAVSGAWIVAVAGIILLDTVRGAKLSAFQAEINAPSLLYIDATDPVPVEFSFNSGPLPKRLEVKLDTNERLRDMPTQGLRGFDGRTRPHAFDVTALERGEAVLETLWVRWRGPLGLVQKRVRKKLDITIPVTPNTRWVKEEAVRIYSRDADFGIKQQIDRGDGSEFDALREFSSGMDRRAIDWKHSARHRQLLAKEFRTERNHNIVFAFDTGRLMCEPLGGVPKLDRAINAALLLAYVSLRSGDKTALYSFDARPGLTSGILTGPHAFTHMQAMAARLDYTSNEANYTLALTDLSSRLERRSLIILFTDFVDTVSAELMLDTIARLTGRHLVLFATFHDAALETMVDAPPHTPNAISRAVIADTLLAERQVVFRKLQRLGVQVIETAPDRFGSNLVSRYLDIKQREML